MTVNLPDFDAALLRRRLQLDASPDDPTRVMMPAGSDAWPTAMQERLRGKLKPAGVLIPLMLSGPTPSLLLTQRSAQLKHHAAQVSFPGGSMEPDDEDIVRTALRETEEEVGIGAPDIDVLGCLTPMPTVTGYAVTPVVGLIESPVNLVVDPAEVEYAFDVPLDFVFDRANQKMVERELHGKSVRMIEFHYQGERIWGATAMMIVRLIKTIKNNK